MNDDTLISIDALLGSAELETRAIVTPAGIEFQGRRIDLNRDGVETGRTDWTTTVVATYQ